MTCIAWDGETLASDKQSSIGGLARTTTKIHRIRGVLAGACGDGAQCREVLAWVRRGCRVSDFPDSQRGENWVATLVIRPGGKIQVYEQTPYPTEYEDDHFAIGSGRDYAMAAMFLGKTAKEAVEVACALDPGCGRGVDVLKLK